MVVITGNPFAMASKGSNHTYAHFESELQKNLSAVVINDMHLVNDRLGYGKKKGSKT